MAASDRNAIGAVGIAAGRDFQRDHSPSRRDEAQHQRSHREADEESDLEAHCITKQPAPGSLPPSKEKWDGPARCNAERQVF